jgi:hypothetical protein
MLSLFPRGCNNEVLRPLRRRPEAHQPPLRRRSHLPTIRHRFLEDEIRFVIGGKNEMSVSDILSLKKAIEKAAF